MMTAKLLRARDHGTSFDYDVHIDTTKTVDDGTGNQVPDPSYVFTYRWSSTPPDGQTVDGYRKAIRRELRAYVADELARLADDPGLPFAEEGREP
jgi:hypothetical protein